MTKHKEYLDMLRWSNLPKEREFLCTKACAIHQGIFNDDDTMRLLRALMFVDDALMAAPGRQFMKKLLAAMIEAIFVVIGKPDVKLHQCPLATDKWLKLVVAPHQVMAGLIIDSCCLNVGVADDY